MIPRQAQPHDSTGPRPRFDCNPFAQPAPTDLHRQILRKRGHRQRGRAAAHLHRLLFQPCGGFGIEPARGVVAIGQAGDGQLHACDRRRRVGPAIGLAGLARFGVGVAGRGHIIGVAAQPGQRAILALKQQHGRAFGRKLRLRRCQRGQILILQEGGDAFVLAPQVLRIDQRIPPPVHGRAGHAAERRGPQPIVELNHVAARQRARAIGRIAIFRQQKRLIGIFERHDLVLEREQLGRVVAAVIVQLHKAQLGHLPQRGRAAGTGVAQADQVVIGIILLNIRGHLGHPGLQRKIVDRRPADLVPPFPGEQIRRIAPARGNVAHAALEQLARLRVAHEQTRLLERPAVGDVVGVVVPFRVHLVLNAPWFSSVSMM